MSRSASFICTTAAIAVAACGFVVTSTAIAQGAEQRFDIPEQSLSKALLELSRQSGVNIVVDPGVVAGKRAPAVVGGRSVDETLAKLLEGTGLVAERSSNNTVVVKESSDQRSDSLETVNVFGTTIEDPILSSRTGDTLRERPQSITVVTRERLDQQNLNSVAAALEQTTGITITNVSFTTQEFYSRGFLVRSIQLDGGAPFVFNNFGYNQLPDLSIYEQVEVIRGADALFSGNGKPGGTIQLVRKRPKAESEFGFSVSAGRWDTFRAQLDATGTVGFDGALRGRVVYVKEDAGSFLDVADTERDLLYGALEADLSESTQVMVGATYDQRVAPHGGFGLPRYTDGRDLGLPRSTVFTADWARFDTKTLDIFGRLDQKIGDRWSVRLNVTRTEQQMRNLRVFGYGAVDVSTGLLPAIYGGDEEFEPTQELVDITLKGSFELFGRTHKVAVGADWQNIDSGGIAWAYPAVTGVDPYGFDPSSIPVPARSVIPNQDIVWGQQQSGAYVSLSLQITDPLRILGGARYSNYEYEYGYDNLNASGAVTGGFYQKYEDRDVVTPYFGFTYELSGGWIGYGSYGESFESQASYISGIADPAAPSGVRFGSAVDPKTGESVEFGIKGGLWNGRAATQFAVYRIREVKAAVLDQSFAPQSSAGVNCCYVAQGETESRGVDMEINGVLLKDWNVFAGYTFNENEYKAGYDALGSTFMPQTPRHLFKLWTTYKLPGALDRWEAGLGLNTQSRTYVRGNVITYDPVTGSSTGQAQYSFTQGGYTLLSARVQYEINDRWSAALNLTNITDKTYYQTVGTSAWSNWYGAPRGYMVTLRGKF